MRKLFLFLITLVLFFVSVSSAYTIIDENVIFENSYAKLNVFPHTARPSNPILNENPILEQTFIATKKISGTQELYIGYVFNEPIQYGRIFQLISGEWIDRTEYMLIKDFEGKKYYYSEFPLTFTDNLPTKTWKIKYIPAENDSSKKWDLIAWKSNDREDIFIGAEDWSILLDPWWENSWGYKKVIEITTTTSSLDQNFTAILNFDTSALISAGKMQADCDDLRIVFQDNIDLNRNVIGCNQTDTNVLFRLQNTIQTTTSDYNYSLYYGNSTATNPPDNNKFVYRISETFANLNDWTRTWNKDSSELQDGTLHLNKDNGNTVTNLEGYCFTGNGNTFKNFVLEFDANGTMYASNFYFDYNGFTGIGQGGGDGNYSTSYQMTKTAVTYIQDVNHKTTVVSTQTKGVNWVDSDWNHMKIEYKGSIGDINIFQGIRLMNSYDNLISSQTRENGTICFAAHGNATDSSNYFLKNIQLREIVEIMPVISLQSQQENTFVSLTFRDENTGVLINPTTLTLSINGSDANSWVNHVSNGKLDINAAIYDSGTWKFIYGDSSHSNRTFIQDINNQTTVSFILGMLNNVKGSNIDFVFYNPEASAVLNDANIEVVDSNNRIAERKTTNLSGAITFFLNPNDSGYTFNINDVNGSDYNYSLTVVTVKQPLNEIDLTSAGNFRIRTSGIVALDLNNLSGDTNIFLLSNTVDFHVIKISNIDANFFDRYYYLRFLGETESYVLQSYLLSASDGSLSNFIALERFTKVTIPGVLLTLKKLVEGYGSPIVVESIETDSVGNALFVVKFNDQYILDISYRSLFESKNITPILSSHEVVIDLGQIVDFNVEGSVTLVSWSPETFLSGAGDLYNVSVDINSASANIIQIDFNVFNDGTRIVTDIYKGVAVSSHNFNKSFGLVDENKVTEVQVVVYYSNGQKAYFFKSYNVDSSVPWLWITGLNDFWEDLGQPGTLFIVTLLAVILTGLISRHIEFNREYAFSFAATIMGFFCLLGAIQWLMWISVSVFALFLLVLRRKLNV